MVCSKLFHLGFDDQLARHFAYLFIRDPISLFEEKLQQDPNTEFDHFEVISYVTGYEKTWLSHTIINF